MVVDGIIANGVTEILKKLSLVVANEITLVWDFNDELKNLQNTLKMIIVVMEDAEKKQLTKAAVRLWMEDLKSIAYDAEDILDEYSYKIICKRTQTGEVGKPSLFLRWRMAHKIKKINENLNKITKRKNDLGLHTIDLGSSSSHELMMKNRESSSFVPGDWEIVGRKNDKSTIIKMLLEEEGGGKHVSVIPIVGMGGLGKTTMAQQVYHDEAVQKHFQLKIWICVSDPFDIKRLYKNIANSIGIPKQYDDATTMDDISHLLQDTFRGKKFILVLDDVWNENPAYWNNFKRPFMVGREGSKILVTTRSEKVALIMVDKFKPYALGILNDNDCWSLFKEIAFGSIAGAKETSNLVQIGKEMIKRCGGLPLAVIFLSSLMRSKKKEEEWKIIRDTKLWHESHEGKNSEILPSLRLSYDYLPSHLKLCFSYCCLFPKDYIINRESLIRLWMAEGFLIKTPEKNAMSMEEIGNAYFHSLLSSFFFQDVVKDNGDIKTCKMHDLVHDLARSVVGKNECFIVENVFDLDYISEETRRLNLLVDLEDKEMLPKVIQAMNKAKKLRTVFVNQIDNTFNMRLFSTSGNAFKENKRLRVLDLSGSYVTLTSSSIGGLKHLRYLEFFAADCFPKGMIGGLSFLQTLSEFKVGAADKKNAGGIEELEGLNHLTGHLRINNLKNVTSGTDACRANLKEKKNLRGLHLSWNTISSDYANNNHEAVLKGLQPHPNLTTLEIDGFEGSKLPKWMGDSSCLPNLVGLTLEGGIYIRKVAGFGALPSLRSLTLDNMQKLECIGKEFYYSAVAAAAAARGSSSTTPFRSLKKLSLGRMHSLKEWVVPVPPPHAPTTYCFPLLEEINIIDCPLLSTITPTTTIFPSLKVLIIHNIDVRAAKPLVTNHLNSLTSLTLYNISGLITLPRQGLMENNNSLLSLEIEWCDEFKGFFPPNKDQEGSGQQLQQISQVVSSSPSCSSSSSLQTLKLYLCPALTFYPNILRSLTSLQKLEIEECKISKSLQDELTCLSSSLKHLEHVKLRKNKITTEEEEEEEEEWRKPSFF